MSLLSALPRYFLLNLLITNSAYYVYSLYAPGRARTDVCASIQFHRLVPVKIEYESATESKARKRTHLLKLGAPRSITTKMQMEVFEHLTVTIALPWRRFRKRGRIPVLTREHVGMHWLVWIILHKKVSFPAALRNTRFWRACRQRKWIRRKSFFTWLLKFIIPCVQIFKASRILKTILKTRMNHPMVPSLTYSDL